MSQRSDSADGWTWRRPIGLLRCGRLTGRVDVSRPQFGVHQLQWEGNPLGGNVFGVAWEGLAGVRPAAVADCYVRAGDLVATYQPQAAWPYTPQVYWRAGPTEPTGRALAALTLWVSVQTDLLDTHPSACVQSQLPADQLLHIAMTEDGSVSAEPIAEADHWQGVDADGVGCLVWRLPGSRISCAQFARKGDVQGLQVQHGPAPESRSQLFAEFLEKGVIRRACLETVVLERKDDVAQAAACCRAFQSRPLPLGT